MRIWHEQLIPKLCRQHLLAVWREGLGAYAIIMKGKKGYRNHPAVIEFREAPHELWNRLKVIRDEATSRGYHFKRLPRRHECAWDWKYRAKPWESLKIQTEKLKAKGCECKV